MNEETQSFEAQSSNPENPLTSAVRRMSLRTTRVVQKRPDPPRDVKAKAGRLSWQPPKAVRGELNITHYNIYADHEFNRVRQVPSDQLFLEDNIDAKQVFVSAWNDTMSYESIKVPVDWEPGIGAFVPGLVFVMWDGTPGLNVGPMLIAPRAGGAQQCIGIVKASDASIDLTFDIFCNGTSIFAAPVTVPAGSAMGTGFTAALDPTPLEIEQHDVFMIDIASGSAAWRFTCQLE